MTPQFWRQLSQNPAIRLLRREVIDHDRERVFKNLILSGIFYLVLVQCVILTIAAIIRHDLELDVLGYIIVYGGITLAAMALILGLYYLNSRRPSLLYKVPVYMLAQIYVVILCVFIGPVPRFEFLLLGLLPLPYFVLRADEREVIALSVITTTIALVGVNFYYSHSKPLLPMPPAIEGYLLFFSFGFNLLIISVCCYIFWRDNWSVRERMQAEMRRTDTLLTNILPEDVARQLMDTGRAEPRLYPDVTVLFTDFSGFTQATGRLAPAALLEELDFYFSGFDRIIREYGLEKLKTIGDAYMAAGGIPSENTTHRLDAALAGWQICRFMRAARIGRVSADWDIRVGIHSGPAIAGVVGRHKFAYDIWGDTVNMASRMESTGEPGRVNICGDHLAIYEKIFAIERRGKIMVKGKGDTEMHSLVDPRAEFMVGSDNSTIDKEKIYAIFSGI